MDNITFYSTHCPKCVVLEKKLKEKNIPFETITDVDVMTSKGLSSAQALEIEGKLYNFKDSINWVNSQE